MLEPMEDDARSWPYVCAALLTLCGVRLLDNAQARSCSAPTRFEVDPNWPSIPNNWVLGEVTSIAVDRNDHIWVLHVPQSIPEAQRANAAPPVLEFDAAGKLLTSWGGPGEGCEWPEREHGIFVDANDFVWIGGRGGWPRPTDARQQRRHDSEVHDGRKVRHADRPSRAEQGQHRHGQRPSGHRCLRRHVGERSLRRRRLRQQARDGVRLGNREVQADVGRVRQPAAADAGAESRRAAAADHARRPAGVRAAARGQGVERRHRLCGGPDQQPHPDVHDATGST